MNAPAIPTSALVMIPRVDPENWRASHDGPARRSNKIPAATPITRTTRKPVAGSVACMGWAALFGQHFRGELVLHPAPRGTVINIAHISELNKAADETRPASAIDSHRFRDRLHVDAE